MSAGSKNQSASSDCRRADVFREGTVLTGLAFEASDEFLPFQDCFWEAGIREHRPGQVYSISELVLNKIPDQFRVHDAVHAGDRYLSLEYIMEMNAERADQVIGGSFCCQRRIGLFDTGRDLQIVAAGIHIVSCDFSSCAEIGICAYGPD